MFKRIRWKLTLYYAGVMALFFVILVFGTHETMEWSVRSAQEREVLLFAEEEAHEHAILFRYKEVLGLKQAYEDGGGRMYFYAFDMEGKLVNAVRPPEALEPGILSRIARWDEAEVDEDEVVVLHFNNEREGMPERRLMMAARPIMIDGKQAGMVYVGRDVTAIFSGLEKSTAIMGAFSALALLLASLAGYFMAGKAIIPLKIAYERQQQFAADASHELRTPLSVVMSSVDVLQKEGEITSPFLLQVLADMKDEIKKMAKLVGDLLIVARSDSQEREIVKERFNLTLTAEQVIRNMQPLAEKKEIRLFFADKHFVELHADREYIEQLLLILIDNAVKYTPQGGMVTVKLAQEHTSGITRIAVQDTGVGIAKEEQARIFERFYRVDQARSRASGGTGLGLAIARGIVESHRGKLLLESAPGRGAVFTAVLPG